MAFSAGFPDSYPKPTAPITQTDPTQTESGGVLLAFPGVRLPSDTDPGGVLYAFPGVRLPSDKENTLLRPDHPEFWDDPSFEYICTEEDLVRGINPGIPAFNALVQNRRIASHAQVKTFGATSLGLISPKGELDLSVPSRDINNVSMLHRLYGLSGADPEKRFPQHSSEERGLRRQFRRIPSPRGIEFVEISSQARMGRNTFTEFRVMVGQKFLMEQVVSDDILES